MLNTVNKSISSAFICGLAGFLAGLIGWNCGINGFSVLVVLPGFWALCKSRLSAFFVILFYYLGSSYELFYGAEVYFDHYRLLNPFFWVLHQMILASGWVIFWKEGMSRFWDIFLRLSLTYILTILIPPYALLGVAHPVTAAGLFFPGIGILGMIFFTCLSAFIAYLFIRIKQEYYFHAARPLLTKITLLIISATFIFMSILDIEAHSDLEQLKEETKSRTVIQTEMGNIQNGTIFIKDYERHLRLKKMAEQKIHAGYSVIIFPEMIAGKWTDVEQELWADVRKYAEEHKAVVLLGVQKIISRRQYDNAVVVLGDKRLVSREILKARVPMPLSNWNPFSKLSATLNISRENNGVIVIADEPTAVLICYEQMLVWPILQSMTSNEKPKTIITISNLWWAKGTDIPKIMENTTKMWGRLFKVPLLRAVNT